MAQNLRIVLGVTGGIAAYKAPSLVRLLRKIGADVKVVCTQAALSLVAKQALFTVSDNTVYTDEPTHESDMEHIGLAKWGNFLLICPATANTIAKKAHGIADNLLTSLALSFEKRLVVAPAMNTEMWLNSATQDNIALLNSRGVSVLPVDEGELACGDCGPGRLLPLETITEFMLSLAAPKLLINKKVLISTGPTREPVDAVRFLSNGSSGKMGAALAHAAWLAGGKVTVVSGPCPAKLPAGVRVTRVETAREMLSVMEKEFMEADICIMAAAVGDFRPSEIFEGKKHREDTASWSLELTANPDIAERLGSLKKNQFLACFSLETGNGGNRAIEKMKRKKCDMMIINRASVSLETDSTQAEIIFPDDLHGPLIPLQSKTAAASRIIEIIADRIKA